ncbi:MAG: hypothetical protein CMJ83_08585 [Planctomycetes bacterium]|nr:hypothetical protein [Planctomycetota bacterium]
MTQVTERADALAREVVYDGEQYERDELQSFVDAYGKKHESDLQNLASLKTAHDEIAREMSKDLAVSKTAWEYIGGLVSGEFTSNFKGLLEKIPILNEFVADRPLSDLLHEKVEVAERRTREVGNFLTTIEKRVGDLQSDVIRLNKKVVVAARNEETAASFVLQLRDVQARLTEDLSAIGDDKSAAWRETKAEIDEVTQVMWEHGAKLRLFSNAEDRITSIVAMNRNFLQILTNLHANMQGLYDAGIEVLDELRGNLSGLATAAQAGELTLDMQEAMQSLKRSVNRVAVLASNTSLYITQNVERLTAEMKVYDDETRALVESNLAAEREVREQRIDETIALAEKEFGLMEEARTTGPA